MKIRHVTTARALEHRPKQSAALNDTTANRRFARCRFPSSLVSWHPPSIRAINSCSSILQRDFPIFRLLTSVAINGSAVDSGANLLQSTRRSLVQFPELARSALGQDDEIRAQGEFNSAQPGRHDLAPLISRLICKMHRVFILVQVEFH